MFLLERELSSNPLNVSDEEKERLAQWLRYEIEDAFAARAPQEGIWQECLRQYEAQGTNKIKNIVIEGVQNIEVPLGAIAADSIYAQALDTMFVVNPTITIQSVSSDEEQMKGAKSLQRLANWGATSSFNLRAAAEHQLLDTCQLGTGVYYIPFVEHTKKTQSHKSQFQGPRIVSLPAEDFLVPGGSYDNHQVMTWNAARFWLTEREVQLRAAILGWDVTKIKPGAQTDWVRMRRELLARTQDSGERNWRQYEIMDVYCYYDIDGDGLAEDLLVTWDRVSASILKIRYNPFDIRPFEVARYQLRSHLFYGIGVLEMLRTMQDEVTQIHNHRNINSFLANVRMWAAKNGMLPETLLVYPNKVLQMSDPNDIKELRMSDVYPSSANNEAAVVSLAERRTGVNDMSMPRPSQILGSRTPGVTAMSMLQQTNRRFTPAFDAMRNAAAGAITQCLFRIQEQLLASNTRLEEVIRKILGDEADAGISQLKDPDFEHMVRIELTASSANHNQIVERQDSLLLTQILNSYYKQVEEMALLYSNPQTPPLVKEVTEKIIKATAEVIDRTIRTFDSVRDPEAFLIDFEGAVVQAEQNAPQDGLNGLSQFLMGLVPQSGESPAPATQ